MILLALLACRDDPAATPPAAAPGVEHVVVVVLDGARLDETLGTGWSTASDSASGTLVATFRRDVLPQGTLVRAATGVGVPATAPAHCDLLTGVRQPYANLPVPTDAGAYRPLVPTLFEDVRARHPGVAPVLLANTDLLTGLSASLFPGAGAGADHRMPTRDGGGRMGDADLLAEIEDVLLEEGPPLVLANLHDIDRGGHASDDLSLYPDAIARVDAPLAALWADIQAGPLADRVVMAVVADHGRHRWGAEADARADGGWGPDWSTHGDHCAGCRELPMFLVGPGIKRGAVVTERWTLEDLGRTVAWLLDADVPHAEGLLMTSVLEAPPAADPSRAGDAAVAAEAVQVWGATPDRRAAVEVDGEVISGDGLAAEAPAFASTPEGDVACWRELTVYPDDPDEIDWPWRGECRLRTSAGWEDLGLPDTPVWPLWRPALAVDGAGRLLVAAVDNPEGIASSDASVDVALHRWSSAEGWTTLAAGSSGTVFPTAPAVAVWGERIVVAAGGSDYAPGQDMEVLAEISRYTRHVEVWEVDWDAAAWSLLWRSVAADCPSSLDCPDDAPTMDADGATWARMESPALSPTTPELAFLAMGDAGTTVLVTAEGAAGWDVPVRVDDSGAVYPHVAPVWAGGRVVWARAGDGVELCSAGADRVAECVGTGAAWIRELGTDGDVVRAVVAETAGVWEAREVGR